MTMIDNPRKFELYYALVQARAIRDTRPHRAGHGVV